MIRSAGVVLLAGALSGLIVWPVYGGGDALMTGALVVVISTAGLAAAHALAGRGSRRRLRSRFVLVVATAVGVILASVVAAVELMFVSDHDALVVSAMVLAAALVALRAAQVASARLAGEVAAIRDVLREVGRGEREPRAAAGGAAELAELADEVNTMIERLRAAETARRNLVASISHDLRTPMTALRLMIDAIEDDLVDPDTAERYRAAMRTHVTALGAMIDDLFELSRLEAGDLEWSMRQVELADLVEETVAAMRVEAEAKGVAVAADMAALSAHGDPERLQRVLFNLIRNAIRHTPPDGSVTVRGEAAGEWVAVEVADTGEGIAAADSAVVFEPFVRGDASRHGGGAGLGMAISRAIVEAHGGRIWLADSDVGTRVRFVIPA
jgi:signal transduction histidine kinase